jgi:hypothetical protein
LGDEVLERDVQHRTIMRARDRGCYVRKLTAMAWRGFPDLIVVRDGLLVFWEIKAKNGQLSRLQETEHKALRDAGMVVLVTYGLLESYRNLDLWFPLENIT